MNGLITAGGAPIVHLQDADVDERFVAMTENPFLHGCCDCGLFHKVEYKIVDAEGNELEIPAGAMLALRFSRDEGQTEHFRGERKEDGAVKVWAGLYQKIQDALLDASIAGVAGAGSISPSDMRLQAIHRYRTDPFFNKRIQELSSRMLSEIVKHEVELEVLRRGHHD